MLLRVSTRRRGTLPMKPELAPPVNQPAMSTRRCAPALVDTQIEPSGPIGATTPFATVAPAAKLTFDASGCGVPHGHTVAKPAARASTIVTLSATAVASAGTERAAPLTSTSRLGPRPNAGPTGRARRLARRSRCGCRRCAAAPLRRTTVALRRRTSRVRRRGHRRPGRKRCRSHRLRRGVRRRRWRRLHRGRSSGSTSRASTRRTATR